MDSLVVAALLSILPTEPSTVGNDFPVAVTHLQVERADGRLQTVARVGAGRRIRVAQATRVVGFELESCPAAVLESLRTEGTAPERDACWRALAQNSRTIATTDATESLRAALLGPRSDLEAAARQALPELVGIVTEGGPVAAEVEELLTSLGWSTPADQLRAVPRARRPALLRALGRHDDGRAFGLLVRAALESSIAAERAAAGEALADYPEDGVQRLSNALEDPAPAARARAVEALGHQDARALPALQAAALALGVHAGEGTSVAELIRRLVDAHADHLAARGNELEQDARHALERGDATAASEALATLEATDRGRLVSSRGLRARLYLLRANEALDAPGPAAERGRAAAESVVDAQSLSPDALDLVDTTLRVAHFLIDAGYPASASRVLGPLEARDDRAAALRTKALGEEVRRLVAAGDRGAATVRLTQLIQEGRDDLAERLDDRYDVRASGAWHAPASLALLLCGCIGFAVQRERRRRRHEFQLIETEQDRGRFNRGPYR